MWPDRALRSLMPTILFLYIIFNCSPNNDSIYLHFLMLNHLEKTCYNSVFLLLAALEVSEVLGNSFMPSFPELTFIVLLLLTKWVLGKHQKHQIDRKFSSLEVYMNKSTPLFWELDCSEFHQWFTQGWSCPERGDGLEDRSVASGLQAGSGPWSRFIQPLDMGLQQHLLSPWTISSPKISYTIFYYKTELFPSGDLHLEVLSHTFFISWRNRRVYFSSPDPNRTRAAERGDLSSSPPQAWSTASAPLYTWAARVSFREHAGIQRCSKLIKCLGERGREGVCWPPGRSLTCPDFLYTEDTAIATAVAA